MYADDIVLLSTSPQGLQNKLDILKQYCNDWCLTVNTNKTKVLIFNKAGKHIKHTFNFNDTQLECVNRYIRVLLFCTGRTYKKALQAYFKFSKDLLSLHQTIKTNMHVFDHTIKPILLYDCEVWGMFNPFISKFRNTLLNISRIFDKLPAEKLHQKLCKYILGVHSKTSNAAVLSELGRFSIYFNIVQALVKYYYRLKNIQSDFPVVHDASEESKILSHSNKPSWYAFINYIFKIIKTYKSGNNDNVNAGGKLLQNYFFHEWKQNLQAQANGKLCSYVLFKSNFGCEKYLFVINNIEIRKHFFISTFSKD